MNNPDLKREDFWDELCGTTNFVNLGLKEINQESLKIFDKWYFDYYPYLKNHVNPAVFEGKDVLEIGLGFGTLSQYLFDAKNYTGVDFASGPVNMVNSRASMLNKSNSAKAIKADARNLPFPEASFDTVIAIGCFHHTGNTLKAIEETYRVLKPGGTAVIMLYNKYSFRQILINPLRYLLSSRKFKGYNEFNRFTYDSDMEGNVAPIVEYYSKKEIKNMFSSFLKTDISPENFDNYYYSISVFKIPFSFGCKRNFLIKNIAHILGLDLYITAIK